jgi:hypothetical protein
MSDERTQVSVNDEYIEKYGFHEVENYAFKSRKGLDVEIVKDISRMKKEPEWMTDFRLRSLEAFYAKPMPNWGSEVLQQIDFNDIFTTLSRPRANPLRGKTYRPRLRTPTIAWAFRKPRRNIWPAWARSTSLR